MSSGAGGVGLGLVFGWLAATSPWRWAPARLAALATGLVAVVAEAAWLGRGAAAAWCAAAVGLGALLRLGLVATARKGAPA